MKEYEKRTREQIGLNPVLELGVLKRLAEKSTQM